MRKSAVTFCALLLAAIAVPAAAQFRHTLPDGPKPWSKTPVVGTENYRFVVLADKTGGPETGIFPRAVDEVNRLAPDFVLSIGDLVDGYLNDPATIRRQWSEIFALTDRLEAPLFYVGGNHDLSNPTMVQHWRELFGATYYHFEVGRDLFLVLDTEEPGGLSAAQIAYFSELLNRWEGRWIYVFMHRPLWYPKNHAGYEAIDALLQGRAYTVFSGHEHQYYMERRNGRDYYLVATTGGDSQLRGPQLGEFDHYFFVTARDPEPVVANLQVGALLPNDVVNPETKPMVNTLLGGRYAEVVPALLPEECPASFGFEIALRNPCAQPMHFTAAMPAVEGLTFVPQRIETVVPAGETARCTVTVQNPDRRSAAGFEKLPIAVTGGYELVPGSEICTVPAQKMLLLDWNRPVPAGAALAIACDDPAYIKESWDWHGPADGCFALTVENRPREVVITVRTTDDQLVRSDDPAAPQDKVTIWLATDAAGPWSYELVPERPMQRGGTAPLPAKGSCTLDGHSLVATLTIPKNRLRSDRFRLNVAWTDSDNPLNMKPSVLWWKPVWGTAAEFAGSGLFILQ